jgi:hypothetical protein
VNLVWLGARTGIAESRLAEEATVESHADEDDELGAQAADLPPQGAPAGFELVSAELRGRARGARTEIRQGDLEFSEATILGVGELFRNQSRREEEPPEWIARPREMMSDGFRAQAGVDAHQEDLRAEDLYVPQRHRSQACGLAHTVDGRHGLVHASSSIRRLHRERALGRAHDETRAGPDQRAARPAR